MKFMASKSKIILVSAVALIIMLAACSPTRHVPQGQYLLDEVKVKVMDSSKVMTPSTLLPYVRQRPNNKFLEISRLRLGVYNMSGNDSSKWWNKWLRRLGEAPVLYNPEAVATDSAQLVRALRNAGYLDASVSVDTIIDRKKRKLKLNYEVNAGNPQYIKSVSYDFPDETFKEIIMADSNRLIVGIGERLDRDKLELQRELITESLRNKGYWAFSKDFITFNADTTQGSKEVDLTMIINPPYPLEIRKNDIDTHKAYIVKNITVVTDFDGDTMKSLS